MKRKIEFTRDDLTLVGNLFTPAGFDEGGQYNAVVVEGSFSSVKEQMAGTYAEKFAEQGFVALAFDYAHYGESAGEATVAAFLPGPAVFSLLYGGEDGVTQRKQGAVDARRKYEETGEVVVVPAYSETDVAAINYGPSGSFDYYLNEQRGNVPEYRNETALMSLEQFLDFDPVSQASAITTPTMVVHSDESAFPDQAKSLYEGIPGEKELVWADGNHYDYYDSPAQIDNAVANVTRFFNAHLSAGTAS